MSEPTTIVGKRLPRVDGIEKATGAAKYTADIRLPGMLHAKIKRSPHAHARIVSIDTSRAARLPGVKAILTAGRCAARAARGPARAARRVAGARPVHPGRQGSFLRRWRGCGRRGERRCGRGGAGTDRGRVRGAAGRLRPRRGDAARCAQHPRHRAQPGHPAGDHRIGRRGGRIRRGRLHLRGSLRHLPARARVHGAVRLRLPARVGRQADGLESRPRRRSWCAAPSARCSASR